MSSGSPSDVVELREYRRPQHFRPPVSGEIGPIRLGGIYTSRSSTCGYEIVGVERGDIPYFELRLRLNAGSAITPAGSALPRLVSASFLSGTAKRSSEDISRKLQSMGASISCSIGTDGTLVSASGLSEHFEEVVELLCEAVVLNDYPEDEVAVSKARVMQSLAISLSEPSRIARDALRKAIYKRHPYGRPTPEPDSVVGCRRSDLLATHRKIFRGEEGRFIVVSNSGYRRVVPILKRVFDRDGATSSHWGKPNMARLRAPRPSFSPRTILVDRPGAVQTVIRIGMESPRRSDPLYHAFLLANTVFGGYFSSRLVENVRENKGYTYSISSSIMHRRLGSMLTVATDVATEVTAEALVEIFYEIDRMRAAPPAIEEMKSARRYLVGATAISLDTYGGTAATLDSLYAAGLDKKFLEEMRDRLYSLSASDVYDAACEYLDRSRAVTVLVGDAAKITGSVSRICGDSIQVVKSPRDV
jgi:zinc protease